MKKNKLLSILSIALFSLTSCDLYADSTKEKIDYNYLKVKEPFVSIEKNESHKFVELTVEDLEKKFEGGDSFLLFTHRTTCGHCTKLESETLIPLMLNSDYKIYGLTTDKKENIDISSYTAFFAEDERIWTTCPSFCVPVFQVIHNGEIKDYTIGGGVDNDLKAMVKAYCILDEGYIPTSGIVNDSIFKVDEEKKEEENSSLE